MNPMVVKVVPTVLVLAAGAYVVWPYLGSGGETPAAAAAAPEAAELADSLLRPKPSAPPARNPFEDPEDRHARALKEVKSRMAELVKRVETARKQAALAASKSVTGLRGGKAGQGGLDALAGLALNATYTREGKGAAVINGRVFQTGENVRPDRPDDACVLKQVSIHSVVLSQGGQDLVLKYGMAAPAGRTSTATAGAAKPSAHAGVKPPAVKRGKSKAPQNARS
jgi:hypothetical protein